VSRDVTTFLLATVYRPSAGTSYDQHVHQIGSLYVYTLRRYEGDEKCQKWRGFGVTQGHPNHCHLIERI